MSKRDRLLRVNDRRVNKRERQIAPSVADWLNRFAQDQIKEALRELKTGRIMLSKAEATDEELLRILSQFGLRQVSATGQTTADALDGKWVIPPGLVDAVIRSKKINVKNITRGVVRQVKEEIRRIMANAAKEIPQPSIAELSRRIKSDIANLHSFSEARAGLIARTEALQNEQTGIFTGMEVAGVQEIEWLSSKNPNHGKRAHQLMNGMKVKLGEMFTNPTTGRQLRYPGDPQAHISEVAACGCTYAPVRIQKAA